MLSLPTPENFARWNEEILAGNSPAAYLNNSRRIVTWIESRRVSAVLKLLNAGNGDKVLEIACGSGQVLGRVEAEERHGIDISARMIMQARIVLPSGYFVRGDAERLPYPACTFDRIFCTSVLSHVLNPDRVLREAFRVLRRRGRLVVSVTNEGVIERGIRIARLLHLDGVILKGTMQSGNRDRVFAPDYHIHRFDLRRLLTAAEGLPSPVAIKRIPSRICPVHLLSAWDK